METIKVITPYESEPDFKKIKFTVGGLNVEIEFYPQEHNQTDSVILSGYYPATKQSAWVSMRAPTKGSVLYSETKDITFEIGSASGDGVETNAHSAKEWSHVLGIYYLMSKLKKFLKQ